MLQIGTPIKKGELFLASGYIARRPWESKTCNPLRCRAVEFFRDSGPGNQKQTSAMNAQAPQNSVLPGVLFHLWETAEIKLAMPGKTT
jgi:hypothetical protein